MAAGILSPDLIAPALRRTVKKQANARTLLAEVYHLDLERKVVVAREADGRMLELAGERSWIEGGASVFVWVLRRQLVSARPPSMEDAAC